MAEKFNLNIDKTAIKSFLINFLVPLICIGIIAVLGFLVLYPSFKTYNPLKKEVADKNTLSTQLATKLANLESLKEFKSVVEQNSTLVQQVLVNEAMVPQLLTQIDQVARESGLTVTKLNYSFSDPTIKQVSADGETFLPESPFKTVDVSLGTDGNFDQLVTFLANTENSARLVSVDTFRYTTAEKDASTFLNISFSLKSPYMKVESQAVTDDPVNLVLSDKEFVATINKIKGLKFYNISLEGVKEEFLKETPEASQSTPAANVPANATTPSSPFQ